MQIQLNAKTCSRDTTKESSWKHTSLPLVDAHMTDGFLTMAGEKDINNEVSPINHRGHAEAPERGLFNFPTYTTLGTHGFSENIVVKRGPSDCFVNGSLSPINVPASQLVVAAMQSHNRLLPTKKRTKTSTSDNVSLEKSPTDMKNIFFQGEHELSAQNWESNIIANPSSSCKISPHTLQGSSKLSPLKSIRNPFSAKISPKSPWSLGNEELLTTNESRPQYPCEQSKVMQIKKPHQVLAVNLSNYPISSQIVGYDLEMNTTVTHIPPVEGIPNTGFLGSSNNQLWSFDGKVSPVKEVIKYPTINDQSLPKDVWMEDCSGPTFKIPSSRRNSTYGWMPAEATPPIGAFVNIGFVNKLSNLSKKKLSDPVSKIAGPTCTSPIRSIVKAPTWMKPAILSENATSCVNTTSSHFNLPPVFPVEAINNGHLPFKDTMAVPSLNESLDILEVESSDSEQGYLTFGKTEESTFINPLVRSEGIEGKSVCKRSTCTKLSLPMQCNSRQMSTLTQPAVSFSSLNPFPMPNRSMVQDQASQLMPPAYSPILPVKRADCAINSKVSPVNLNGTTTGLERASSYFDTNTVGTIRPPLSTTDERRCTFSAQRASPQLNENYGISKINDFWDCSKSVLPKIEIPQSIPLISMGQRLPVNHTELCNPTQSNFFPLVFKEESDNPVYYPVAQSIGQVSKVYSSNVTYHPSIVREPKVKVGRIASLDNNIKLELSYFASKNGFKKVESGTSRSSRQVDAMLRRKRAIQKKLSIPSKRQMRVGEARYPCCICGKTFKQRCHLYRHIRQHTGKKRFICQICSHGFFQRSNLRQHARTHSTNEKISHRFACHICPKRFTRKQGMVKHIEKIHGSIF